MVKVGVRMPSPAGDPAEFLADVRALEAAGADMVAVAADETEHGILLGAVAAITERMRLLAPPSGADLLQRLSRGRVVERLPDGWVEAEFPADRREWTEMLRQQEAAGAAGVMLPWDPRVIDLLRNPNPDDRGDLLMATG